MSGIANSQREEASQGSDVSCGDSTSLSALEEKAGRYLKRFRYADAAECFELLIQQLAQETSKTKRSSSRWSSIAALEGLAICRSRQLDDAGAEVVQRQALALRRQAWEQERERGFKGAAATAVAAKSVPVGAAKRAALLCLRNLASFVANQGRHKDAEVVLRKVLEILEHDDGNGNFQLHDKMLPRKSQGTTLEDKGWGLGELDGGTPAPTAPSSTSALARGGGECFDSDSACSDEGVPSGVEEGKHTYGDDGGGGGGGFLAPPSSYSCGDCGGRGSSSTEGDDEEGKEEGIDTRAKWPRLVPTPTAKPTADFAGDGTVVSDGSAASAAAAAAADTSVEDSDENVEAAGSDVVVTGWGRLPASSATSGVAVVGAGVRVVVDCCHGAITAAAPPALDAPVVATTTTAAEVEGSPEEVMSTGASRLSQGTSPRDSSPQQPPSSALPAELTAGNGASPPFAPVAPPPAKPTAQIGHADPAIGRRSRSSSSSRDSHSRSSSSGGRGGSGGGGGYDGLERGRLSRVRPGETGAHRGGEKVEAKDAGRGDGDEEDLEQMAAVTRHHLAVVVHAQARTEEAELLLEESLRVLRGRPQENQAVWIAQALHDLAGVVRSTNPARAVTLYREALHLLEESQGVNHFLTAPTLSKLGSLLAEYLLVPTPPAPAAPAGPGPQGLARSAGLAEAVCAAAGPAAAGAPAAARGPGGGRLEQAEAVAAAAVAGGWDAKEAENMIKRAALIQGRHLGLRHPAVASSMRAMAELCRRQGRLAEAAPLFRRAIGIWDELPSGPSSSEMMSALHGLAHCVLVGEGADWLGRFEEAFALVDQAYRIASSQPGSESSSRLLLEALRMIRSRQRQGRGDPQPASAGVMRGVLDGSWDPTKKDNTGGGGGGGGSGGGSADAEANGRARSRSGGGDNPRCAVCLEEVGGGDSAAAGGGEESGAERGERTHEACWDWTVEIGSEEAQLAETAHDAHARQSFAYLPCGHSFHRYCIGRWLVYSSSCPSCRSKVEDEQPPLQSDVSLTDSTAFAAPAPAPAPASSCPTDEIGAVAVATRSVGVQAGQAGVGVSGGGRGRVGREGGVAGSGVRVPDARAPCC